MSLLLASFSYNVPMYIYVLKYHIDVVSSMVQYNKNTTEFQLPYHS